MSNVPAFRPTDDARESARLRELLRRQLARVRHWRMDRAHNLMPTEGSLATAEAEIKAALAQQKEPA